MKFINEISVNYLKIANFENLSYFSGQSAPVWGRVQIPIKYQARFLSSTKSNSGKVEDWNSAERDWVNFPDFHPPERTPPVRHHWIPESYFSAFHSRTGVTGPYVLPVGFMVFMASKELWVVEHNVIAGPMLFIMLIAHVRGLKWAGFDQWWESSYNSFRTMFTSIRQVRIILQRYTNISLKHFAAMI